MRRVLARVLLLCTSASAVCAACTASHPAPASAELQVHVGLFGGPLLPNGKMADSNAPQPDAPISVADRTGHMWRAKTDQYGVATVSIPPGQYTVSSSSCGSPQRVTVVAGKRAYVHVVCAIP